ncbi:hypothetical protein [Deinococcus cavernae]|uniref:hypothetical protein n=1 Tax=Deinococcus cavernae TaxID=2320857 RepID=UPI0011C21817|nr:hypothetical protein [Deinococcus cavernae]
MQKRHTQWWILLAVASILPIQQLKEGQPLGVVLLNFALMSVFAVLTCHPDRMARWSLLLLTALLVAVVNGLFFSSLGLSLLAVAGQAAAMTILLGGFSELVWRYQRKNNLT